MIINNNNKNNNNIAQIGKMGLQMSSLNGNPLASNLLNPAGDHNYDDMDDDGDDDDDDGDDDNALLVKAH